MAERVVTVRSTSGLHARPAALFVEAVKKVCAQSGVVVTIAREGAEPAEAFDASSILALMGLGAIYGDRVVLRADGEQAEEALEELARVIETNHDADA